MSTGLVTINTNTQLAQPPVGGGSFFGGGSKVFRLKPANVELQQKTSRSEGSQEGKFRNSLTGEHYEELRLVPIFDPTEPRSMYESKDDFGKPPLCYSMDGERPSERAQQPQALTCARCRHSDWTKWKKTRKSEDLPRCKQYAKMFVVDRTAKIPFRFAIRGKSISPWRDAMATISSMAELFKAQKGFYPQLHDFVFTVKSVRKVDNKGVYYVMDFSEIKMIAEDDRAEFGALYQRFVAERQAGNLHTEAEDSEEDLDSAMGESTAQEAKGDVVAAEPEEVVTI